MLWFNIEVGFKFQLLFDLIKKINDSKEILNITFLMNSEHKTTITLGGVLDTVKVLA